jgi:hypothetical protein
VNTEGGVAYTPSELSAMIEEAGLSVERIAPIGENYVTTVVEARKP